MLASTVQFSNNTPTRIEHQDLPAEADSISENPSGSYFLPGKNVCSFRTQQCVDISTSTTDSAAAVRDGDCQRSTHEQPPNHIRVRNGLCHNRYSTLRAGMENAP